MPRKPRVKKKLKPSKGKTSLQLGLKVDDEAPVFGFDFGGKLFIRDEDRKFVKVRLRWDVDTNNPEFIEYLQSAREDLNEITAAQEEFSADGLDDKEAHAIIGLILEAVKASHADIGDMITTE